MKNLNPHYLKGNRKKHSLMKKDEKLSIKFLGMHIDTTNPGIRTIIILILAFGFLLTFSASCPQWLSAGIDKIKHKTSQGITTGLPSKNAPTTLKGKHESIK
jgi:hypothetical protein